jgi:asparagine synthase (glutamine-hydrolysing)
MYGIAGITGKSVTDDQLLKMMNKIEHRGPDNTVIRKLPAGGVGCCELFLSRPSTTALAGEEPLVLLDGEIYNHLAEDRSAAEVVRELYLREGKACFSRLEGSFACVIIDGEETILARDEIGARPLIYRTEGKSLSFASEAKGLLGCATEVEELPPGHYFSSREGLRRFPGFSPATPDFDTPAQAAAILRELLIKAVGKMMADGTMHGVALSGGLDSSIIAAIAKTIDPKIMLFSTTIERYPSKDLEFAKLMADFLNLEHHIYQITDQDITSLLPKIIYHLESFDEDCVSGAIANFYTSKMTSGFTNNILVGEGADELFGGYFAELKEVGSEEEKEKIARRLVRIAYNTALRRLDRGWLSNSVNYRTPFLDQEVVAFSNKIPMALKVFQDRERGVEVEKWILREAFKGWLPAEITCRTKLRFAGGTGVDDLMDELTAPQVSAAEFQACPRSETGMVLNSPKELYYYRLFREQFPAGFEKLTVRWDPFK